MNLNLGSGVGVLMIKYVLQSEELKIEYVYTPYIANDIQPGYILKDHDLVGCGFRPNAECYCCGKWGWYWTEL